MLWHPFNPPSHLETTKNINKGQIAFRLNPFKLEKFFLLSVDLELKMTCAYAFISHFLRMLRMEKNGLFSFCFFCLIFSWKWGGNDFVSKNEGLLRRKVFFPLFLSESAPFSATYNLAEIRKVPYQILIFNKKIGGKKKGAWILFIITFLRFY